MPTGYPWTASDGAEYFVSIEDVTNRIDGQVVEVKHEVRFHRPDWTYLAAPIDAAVSVGDLQRDHLEKLFAQAK